jgi:hypothetical protein
VYMTHIPKLLQILVLSWDMYEIQEISTTDDA